MPQSTVETKPLVLPGLAVAAAAALIAWGISSFTPIPLLTLCVVLGIIVAQIPALRPLLGGILAPGISVAAKRFMRLGIVLLGLQLSIGDILSLGWVTILVIVGIVIVTFVSTWGFGRMLKLPDNEPILMAAGFSICGASAIGAMSGAIGARTKDSATPVALVTLCGTLAIAVLPALWPVFGLSAEQFGFWSGVSVHDVGQVVATAQIAGTSALALAVVVKLTRVVMLAPLVSIAAVAMRRSGRVSEDAKRPAIVPLFVAGFLAAVVLRTLVDVPVVALDVAGIAQTAFLALALFGLGTAVRLGPMLRTGWRAFIVALGSWIVIAALGLAATVWLV